MIAERPTGSNRLAFAALVTMALLVIGFGPATAQALDLLLGTGDPGTFSHFTGRTICRIINSQSLGYTCKSVPVPDDVDNLTNLQGGSLDMTLVDTQMLHDAVSKKGAFEFLDISYDNLRLLTPIYNRPITLVARREAGITSLDSLKGKRLNTGPPRSAQHRAVSAIMAAKGWSETDFGVIQALSSSLAQDTMAFCHGSIQAMVHIGVHPDPALQKLRQLCAAQLVSMTAADVERLVAVQPAFSGMQVAAGVYPSQSEVVRTFGTRVVLATTQDLDEETAAAVIEALGAGRRRLQSAHPALLSNGVAVGKPMAGVQLHPAAVR
jgi:TRAP transporter TAXI family solute receptor